MMEVFNQPSGKKKKKKEHHQENLSGWQMKLKKKRQESSTILSIEENVYIDNTYLVRKGLFVIGQTSTSRLKALCFLN